MKRNFLAFDLGATSGRTILGTINDGKVFMEELTRFPNQYTEINGHYYWNIYSLYEHLLDGLKACAKVCKNIESIGIDTWGVDFAFIGEDGSILGLPYSYRDSHTNGKPEEYFEEVMSREKVYEKTGIQVMNFNSLYQFYALRKDKSSQLAASSKVAFIPDALSYMLTGNLVTEYTIASTSQMINPYTKKFDNDLLKSVGLSESNFGRMVMPGDVIGLLDEGIAERCGLGRVPVIAVAGHDTASAVAAVPASDSKFAYLSSGTWSLMGIETPRPVINDKTYKLNITNEGGADGSIRLLKNITGMWILEECLKELKRDNVTFTYPEIEKLASEAEPFRSIINPDDPSFAAPKSMMKAIKDYCTKTSQPVPESNGELFRCIYESLALRYRSVFELFKEMATSPIERMNIIGGGSKNKFMSQLAANSLGIKVLCGPTEATAIGNVMLQAKAAGVIDSLVEMRKIIANSIELTEYDPKDAEVWEKAYNKISHIY